MKRTTMITGRAQPASWPAAFWLLVVLLSVALVACTQAAGADIPTAGASQATPPALVDEMDATLMYAQCIRDNGYPEFPDPIPGRGIMLRRDQGMSFNDPRYRAAQEACQELRPPGMGGGSLGMGMGSQSFADEEAILAFAQCMRDNGVPEFPDPSSGGGPMIVGPGTGMDPNSPSFQAALRTCVAVMTGEDQ